LAEQRAQARTLLQDTNAQPQVALADLG